MSAVIELDSIDKILDFLRDPAKNEGLYYQSDLEDEASQVPAPMFVFGDAFNLVVRLPEGYHKEMPAQFLDAYYKESQRILRLIALILNGRADIKTLTAEQLEKYRFSVQVDEGSSEFVDNAKDVLARALTEAFSKMSGEQAVIAILGAVAIISTAWGWSAYIAYRKETRLAETERQGRRDILEGVQAGQEAQAAAISEIVNIMRDAGQIGRHAADAAEAVQADRLRAAAQTNVTEVGGIPITREEARELRSTSRRQAEVVTIEREMRVVDVNTSDMANTSLVLEDVVSGEQSKVVYSDRILDAVVGDVAVDALRRRSTAYFTLRERRLEGEVVSVEIVSARASVGGNDPNVTAINRRS